jgi:hypothetical protein
MSAMRLGVDRIYGASKEEKKVAYGPQNGTMCNHQVVASMDSSVFNEFDMW